MARLGSTYSASDSVPSPFEGSVQLASTSNPFDELNPESGDQMIFRGRSNGEAKSINQSLKLKERFEQENGQSRKMIKSVILR